MQLFGKLIYIGIACCILLMSCDAPRNNPLDPVSNETPYKETLSIISVVTNGYFKSTYEVFIRAKIIDKNQVIDSVYIENSYFEIKKYLSFNSDGQVYERRLTISDLNTDKFEDIVGHEFRLKIKDYSSRIFDLGAESVKRVVLDDIKITSPINGESVNNPLKLTWEKFNGQFSFNYKIELHVDEHPYEIVWENDVDIHSDSTSTIVNTTLPTGEYYWIIWGIDQFQNKFSSKPATFKVR